MRAGHRSYSDAVSWLTSMERSRIPPSRFALRLLDGSVVAGIVVLGVIGLVSPASFGSPGAAPFKSGRPWLVLLGLVSACVAVVAIRWRRMATVLRELRRRSDATDEALAGAVAALTAAPAALRTRFATTWVFIPGLLFVIGATFAFSTSYFAVDAVLARFRIGWQQPVLGVADGIVAFLLFRIASRRLALWPHAYRIYRELN